MRAILSAYIAGLYKIFGVTSASITDDRRGNMPPPSGGVRTF